MKEKETLISRMKELMGEQSNRDFAKDCGVSEGTIRGLLRGKAANINTLRKIAHAKDKELSWLLNSSGGSTTATNHAIAITGQISQVGSIEVGGALVRAGITRRIRPYDLRHLAASAMLDAGADLKSVSEILGHASPDLTLRTYQHTSTILRREAVARLGNPLPTVTTDNDERTGK